MKAGEPVPPEAKARMVAAQRARHRRALEESGDGPAEKRCPGCGEVKPVEAFTGEKRRLKCGLIVVRPASECKPCKAKRAAARREKLRREGVDLAARQRQYNQNRDREKTRAYAREWGMAKRREEGRPERGPWLKYRGRRKEGGRSGSALPTEPLARFLDRLLEQEEVRQVCERTATAPRRLFSIVKREYPTLTLETVDRILTGLGCPEQLAILYPDRSTGYHVIAT